MQCLGPAPKGMYDIEALSDLDRVLNLKGETQDELYSKDLSSVQKHICVCNSYESTSD